ncbi:hypothetical protein ACQ4WP_21975 [Janthinobacterium sp. GB4P2]|uniref:hypothetical protein n=1 Tax=Janthinobacterium sp. GB4P2 TaxID=3424189 RepID=UPI003F273BF7
MRHVFAWAALHRFHHMKYGTAGDVNFSLFFTCRDRLLGTAFDAPELPAGLKQALNRVINRAA